MVLSWKFVTKSSNPQRFNDDWLEQVTSLRRDVIYCIVILRIIRDNSD